MRQSWNNVGRPEQTREGERLTRAGEGEGSLQSGVQWGTQAGEICRRRRRNTRQERSERGAVHLYWRPGTVSDPAVLRVKVIRPGLS